MLRRDRLQRFRFLAGVVGDYESVALGTAEAAALFGAKRLQKTGDTRPVEVRRMTDELAACLRFHGAGGEDCQQPQQLRNTLPKSSIRP